MSDTFFPIAQQENVDREFDVVDDFSMYCKFRFYFQYLFSKCPQNFTRYH